MLKVGEQNMDIDGEPNMHASMWLEESSEAFCPGEAAEERLILFHESWSGDGAGGEAIRRTSSSSLLLAQNRKDLNRYGEDDFHYGRMIGKGSFSTAHCVYLRSSNRNLRRGGHKEESGQAYALKKLQPRVYKENTLLKTAVSDIALEAAILSNLKHENIITLYGVKEGDMLKSLKDGSFFLVLDLLVETLDVRMRKWLAQRRPLRAKIRSEGVRERLQDVALGIAKGMEYLHSKHIIFRDLKPANIGFDECGDVKIFDFGLSREIDPEISSSQQFSFQPRLMTGGAGTPRYMAPEVAKMDQSYGFPADVYSFTILLWQIVTKQTPFGNISSPIEFAAKVLKGNKRPPLRNVDSDDIKALLQAGWSVEPEHRPTFLCMYQSLTDILKKMEEPDACASDVDSSTKKTKRNSLRHTTSDQAVPRSGFLLRMSSFGRAASSSGGISSLPTDDNTASLMQQKGGPDARSFYPTDLQSGVVRKNPSFRRSTSNSSGTPSLPKDDSHLHSPKHQKKKKDATSLQPTRRRMWHVSSLHSTEGAPEEEIRGLSSVVQEAQRNMSQSLSQQVQSEKQSQRRILTSSVERTMRNEAVAVAGNISVKSIASATTETCSCGTNSLSESGCRSESATITNSPK